MKFKAIKNIKMSPMEEMIYNLLSSKNIKFYQEVTFDGCINPKTGHNLRYDFYIKSKNMLIEYDSKEYHKDEDVLYRDKIKDEFAKNNKIKLVRLKGKSSVYSFMQTLPTYEKQVKKVKKKKSTKHEVVYLESAIERYNKGLQSPTLTNVEERKQRKEKLKIKQLEKDNKKSKESTSKKSTWQPSEYKRIILV